MRLPDGDRGLTELLDLGYDLLRLYAKKPLTMEHGSPEMAGRFSCFGMLRKNMAYAAKERAKNSRAAVWFG